MVRYMVRVAQPDDRRRSDAIAAERRTSAAHAIVRLQRSAGNRAVGRVLARAPTPGIAVRKGSKLAASELVNVLKKNKNVPAWLTKG